jgi:hypothetical protein
MLLPAPRALPDDPGRVSMVPWKLLEAAAPPERAPLVLFWIPQSREELRRSELLTSPELTLFASRCVAMRVVRSDDHATLERLGIDGDLPAAVLTDSEGRVEGRCAALSAREVEEMVRKELAERSADADALLDVANRRASAGDIESAEAMYQTVWEQRCVCPRQGKDARRALKKLKK